jgi:hypothetical protein
MSDAGVPPPIPPPTPPQALGAPKREEPPVINAAEHRVIPPPLLPEAWIPRSLKDSSPEIRKVEQLRRATIMLGIGFGIWIALLPLATGLSVAVVKDLGLERLDDPSSAVALAVFLLVPCAYLILGVRLFQLTNKRLLSFRREFKQVVFPIAARLVHDSFSYRIGGIPLGRFLEGRLFLQRVDNYLSEDFFCGKSGATTFEFSEIDASYETKDIRGNIKVYQVFRGIYFIADFNKHFRTRTIVIPDTGEKEGGFFGWLFRSSESSRGRRIRLEDPEFEREFDAFGDDEVEARYILTPALMARILALKRRSGQVALSFLNGQVHVALGVTRDLFEPGVFTRVSDARQIAEFLNDLRSILAIIEVLNLNTRIWSKS